jgi:hypothetical protein
MRAYLNSACRTLPTNKLTPTLAFWQILSSTEAFNLLLPGEFLLLANLKPSLTAQIFGKAFSSIFYDCNEQWDRSNFWNKASSRKKDKEFCDAQVWHSGILELETSDSLHFARFRLFCMILLLPAYFSDYSCHVSPLPVSESS